MPLASCLPTLSAPSQTSPQLLFYSFVFCGAMWRFIKARIKKQESKSKNPKQQRTHFCPTTCKNPTDDTRLPRHFFHFPFSTASQARLAMPPTRGRTRRGLMADDDDSTTPSGSALRAPPLSAPAKCGTKRIGSRSGRRCRCVRTGRGASRSGGAGSSDARAQGDAQRAPPHAQAL